MTNLHNSGVNAVIKQFSGQAPGEVISAIQKASAKSGVDFNYLMNQAKAESSFNPDAKAKTSSASGLYQFIKSTWMDMVNRHGDKYGIDVESMTKQELLDLRFDPEVAANMAAEFASENKAFLDRHWGGDVGSTEMYFAHFLGAGGAASFLRAKDENPMRIAADLFPKAASANRNVFYDSSTGKPKTLAEVYNFFDKKFTDSPSSSTSNSIDTSETPMSIVPPKKPQANSSLFRQEHYGGQQSIVRTRKTNPMPLYNLVQSPVELMLMADMRTPIAKNSGQIKSKLF